MSAAVWQRLLIKKNAILVVNPPKGYTAWLKGSGAYGLSLDDVELQGGGEDKPVPAAWLFAKTLVEVERDIPKIAVLCDDETNLIVSRGPALDRASLLGAMEALGFAALTHVVVDEKWTATRFKRR